MIDKWKIVKYSSEMHPGRYRVYLRCSPADIKKVAEYFKACAGQPWKIKDEEFDFSFYLNDVPDEEAVLIEKRLEGLKYKLAREANSPAGSGIADIPVPPPSVAKDEPVKISDAEQFPVEEKKEIASEKADLIINNPSRVEEAKSDVRDGFVNMPDVFSAAGKAKIQPGVKNVTGRDAVEKSPAKNSAVGFDVFETDKINGLKKKDGAR